MSYLLDTGVLLRFFVRSDPVFSDVAQCLHRMRREGTAPFVAMQNLTEFWNVSTRPATARGGYGLSISVTQKRIRVIEQLTRVLYPNALSHEVWKALVR